MTYQEGTLEIVPLPHFIDGENGAQGEKKALLNVAQLVEGRARPGPPLPCDPAHCSSAALYPFLLTPFLRPTLLSSGSSEFPVVSTLPGACSLCSLTTLI